MENQKKKKKKKESCVEQQDVFREATDFIFLWLYLSDKVYVCSHKHENMQNQGGVVGWLGPNVVEIRWIDKGKIVRCPREHQASLRIETNG